MWESSAQAVHLLVKKDIEHHGHGCYTEFYNRILCFLSHHSLKPISYYHKSRNFHDNNTTLIALSMTTKIFFIMKISRFSYGIHLYDFRLSD